ncbi:MULTISPECIES: hypothetical protein [unclassified Brevibacterium]|uniref:hypothetical protein n=1 Tax=unclassified Brevibacterium TaxID=2614124 RepID=UPI001E3337F0|nr:MULTISPECIES: hypothetical protein [unclassified Brevibacterium]MDK8434262.1 hypothetical protein [Brevibacterium sp. H-BE7]
MATYRVKTITGQVLTIEADGVEFTAGHVVFWNGSRAELVRALRTPFVTEVTEDQEP